MTEPPTSSSSARDRFWRIEDPELGPTGAVVKGGMWEHQRTWWTLPNKLKLLIGGYGCGKSLILCKRAIATALHNAPVPNLIVSPTYQMAEDVIVRTLVPLLDGKARSKAQEGKSLVWALNRQRLDLAISYQGRTATLMIRSGDVPDRLKGPNVGCAYLDEPFIMERAVLDQVLARVRHPKARLREIGLCGTPEQLNFGFDLAEGDLREKYDVGVVRAPTRANLALPRDYVQSLESAYTDRMRAAYLEGQFVNLAEGLVYYAFDPDAHVVDEDAVPEGAILFAGMDFNVNPMAYVAGWRTSTRMHIFGEFEQPNSDAWEAAKVLRERCGEELREVYPDPTGKARKTAARGGSDFDLLREAGLEVNAPNSPWARSDRFNAVNVAFRTGVLTIGPRCMKLRRNLQTYTHGQEHTTEHKAMGHILDALGYPVAYLFPVSRPYFVERPA